MAKGNTTKANSAKAKSAKENTEDNVPTIPAENNDIDNDITSEPVRSEKPKKANKPKIEDYLSGDFDENKNVRIVNLSNWNLTFRLSNNGEHGDILIPPRGTAYLKRNEIQSQVRNNNVLFVGVDGRGSHAEIYIDDIATRCWLGFETPEKPQVIFTKELVKTLFDMSYNDFVEKLPEYIVTRAEKMAFKDAIEELHINDYSKIKFAAQHLGFRMF